MQLMSAKQGTIERRKVFFRSFGVSEASSCHDLEPATIAESMGNQYKD